MVAGEGEVRIKMRTHPLLGWSALIITAPLLMHTCVQVALFTFGLLLGINLRFGSIIPSLTDFIFIGFFAIPTAVSSYYFSEAKDTKKRLLAVFGMGIPPTILFTIQVLDRLITARFSDFVLLFAVGSGLLFYILLISVCVRFLNKLMSLI